jgi:X-X-X-Leu-X-X-Gly heptad repeat protein
MRANLATQSSQGTPHVSGGPGLVAGLNQLADQLERLAAEADKAVDR